MKIYFSDNSGSRQLQECNLFEVKLANKAADNGVAEQPAYRIYNKDFSEALAISFGGKIDIGKALRDAFWDDVSTTLKYCLPIFNVDEWYGNIKFVASKALPPLNKKHKKGLFKNQKNK